NTEIKRGCPYDCGLCPDHEQHSCLTLLEITEQCNLSCPVCFAGSGPEHGRHRSMEEIEIMIEAIIANEGRPDIVQISGGEPTIHPNFFDIVEWLKNSPVRHVMINTNGVKLMDREFVERLASYKPGIEIYLQFDSLRKETLEELRGGDLRKVRQQAIDNLNEFGLSTTLVVTLKKGLNDQEIGEIMDYAVKQPAVRGITFQPIQIAGRLESFNPATDRLTLTEVRNGILQQSPIFSDEDVLPVPCHPDCLAMAYALKVDGEVYPLTGLIDKDILLEAAKNTIILENDPELLQKGLFVSQLK
ncbi:MAG TPA: radical SAM protein, partial [Paenibacillaceae bacterium]|nr:radical SAM protein [Paenibacillaceae bacterium]